jgi:hypothetical protein
VTCRKDRWRRPVCALEVVVVPLGSPFQIRHE